MLGFCFGTKKAPSDRKHGNPYMTMSKTGKVLAQKQEMQDAKYLRVRYAPTSP